MAPVAAYPYLFEDDEEAAQHFRFRAEGLSFDEMVPHAVDYLNKFLEKRRTAPSAAIRYFAAQQERVGAARGAAVPPGAGAVVELGLFGDLMWVGDGWDTFLDEELRGEMAASDLWLGNLESPIAESLPVPSFVFLPPEFNAAPGLVRSFRRDDGTTLFGALCFANNHTLDMGDEGARETLAFLAAEQIPAVGVREPGGPRYARFEREGISFGVYGATWGLNEPAREATTTLELSLLPGFAPEGASPVDLSEPREVLGEMTRDGVEFRVVILHWGHEYEMYPTALQAVAAREIVHAGADLVLGAHSHVPQPAEPCYVDGYEAADQPPGPQEACVLRTSEARPRKALVLYSLGNFSTHMTTTLCQAGVLERLRVYRRPDGAIDWQIAEGPRLVVNVPQGGPDDTHLLTTMERFLEEACFEGEDGCPAEVLGEQDYLRGFLGLRPPRRDRRR